MHHEAFLSSPKNPRVRNIELLLAKSRERKKQGLFVIEGRKECELALKGNIDLDSWYYFEEGLGAEEWLLVDELRGRGIQGFKLSKEAFEKIAYRESTLGLIIVGKFFSKKLDQLKADNNPLFLIVEGVEKPGNLGAILRTADAAGIDGIICCDQKTDMFNPNVIRASLGCLFTVPWVQCSNEEAIEWLKAMQIQVLATDLEAAVPYHTINYKKPSAVVMGTEALGITETWREAAQARIKIPMLGKIDSLNVSTAAAIVMFEALRQRTQH
jgi:TrmH family RNA methyltransferase